MSLPPCTTVFFDLSSTLAFVQFAPDGEQIATFDVYPGVTGLLQTLRDEGASVGIIFHCGRLSEERLHEVLDGSSLRAFVESRLVMMGNPVLPECFVRAAALAREGDGCAPDARLLYVNPDPAPRKVARDAGFVPVPHPRLVHARLRAGGSLRYLRIRVPGKGGSEWIRVLRAQPVIPFHVSTDPCSSEPVTVYAVGDTRTAAALDDLGFRVDRLGAPDDPVTTIPYLIRDDLQRKHGFLNPVGNASEFFASGPAAERLLASTHEGLMAALSGDERIESFRFTGALEGNTRKLTLSLTHLQERYTVAARTIAFTDVAKADPLCERELAILAGHFVPEIMEAEVRKYAGTDGGPITSRHVHHPGNNLAVEALLADLQPIAPGTTVRHCFMHERSDFWNVVATLPTSEMAGQGVVIVSAHLDSIANEPCPGHTGTDGVPGADADAPGADDDASGMAAVLETARTFLELASLGRPHREVRFAFFNCEEVGRSGSRTYAQAQAALGTQVAAVFHIDMIGYEAPRFEVHAGFHGSATPNAAAAGKRSEEQADLVEHLRMIVGTLPEAQLFTSPEEEGIPRSDHSMFHDAGYPACWITEDFFPDDKGPGSNLNPAYHTSCDTVIHTKYATQIARLVAAAAWIAATR